jgi:LysM repeat protein
MPPLRAISFPASEICLNSFCASEKRLSLRTQIWNFSSLMRLITLLTFITLIVPGLFSQTRDQLYNAYIDQYHTIATSQQRSHGIPASIILAQGLLESGAGRSRLATEGNNHFGIKCHDWQGRKIYHDDDARNECFRKYNHARESFEDHSTFLTTRSRYQALFQLPQGDYKGWAHGLKAAGYATDPNYAFKLIDIIERYELHRFDLHNQDQQAVVLNSDPEKVPASGYIVYKSNGLKIIVARSGDSYTSLASTTGISEERLRFYNDAPANATLEAGNIVYLSRKKKKGSRAYPVHVIQEGETLYRISQNYGIRLLNLYKMNGMSFDKGATIGQVLQLR